MIRSRRPATACRRPGVGAAVLGLVGLVGLVALSAGLFVGLSAVAAGPALAREQASRADDLLARYRSVQGRRDDAGYAARREALEAIADLATDGARKTLRGLLAEVRGDRRGRLLVLEALVKRGGPEEVDLAIREAERDADPALRSSLARVLGRALRPDARAHLRGPALARASPPVQAQVARALGALEDPDAVEPLLALVGSTADTTVRAEALLALGETKDARAVPVLGIFVRHEDPRVREAAARALGLVGGARALPPLLVALRDASPRVVEAAADALAAAETDAAVTPLIDRLAAAGGDDLRLVESLVRALSRLSGASLGDDPDLWRAWWAEASKRPPPEREQRQTTVAGPRYYGFPVRSSRVVFVLDVSRSMGWNGRLETAQAELRQVLAHLPARTRFDLVTFSDTSDGWQGRLVPATPENVKRAVRYVDRQKPVSGTNIHDALRRAFAVEEADSVFFLSDGSPSVGEIVDPEHLLAEVREWNRWRRMKIHAVALVRGLPPSEYAAMEDRDAAVSFLERLASENEGSFKKVE